MKKGIDFVGVTIVFFCHDGNGNILLGKRSKDARDENGTWDIGGGGLELGEKVEERLQKEIEEEYCTEIIEYEFLGYRDVHRQLNGTSTHWVALDFKVLINPYLLSNGEPNKFDEVKMFKFDDLPSPLHSQLPHFFKKYKDELI